MAGSRNVSTKGRLAAKLLVGVAFLAVVVVLLLALAGAFHRKIGDASATGVPESGGDGGAPAPGGEVVEVVTIEVPREESAVGTIRAVHETSVASKLLARVVEVNVSAGQQVSAGDVLVRLDDSDLKARLEQARFAKDAAQAARDQARIELERVERIKESGAATAIEWDRAQTAFRGASAELSRAEQEVVEAESVLGYATIAAPIDGVVIDKRVEVGDTVVPGQEVLSLYDPTRMQLVASVRESLTRRLSVGNNVDVQIDALGYRCSGAVREIVPEAESASRTFSVKVTGPCPPGVFTGMYGRLLIPLENERVLAVPARAVGHVGQLDMVRVVEGDAVRTRAIQLGRRLHDDYEVLAGLREGERVLLAGATSEGDRP